jgi:prevent-host-death family protein
MILRLLRLPARPATSGPAGTRRGPSSRPRQPRGPYPPLASRLISNTSGPPTGLRLEVGSLGGRSLGDLPGWPVVLRDLRNHTAEVLRRVEAGEEIEVLRDNRPVAKIVPLSRRRQWLPAAEIGHELMRLGPDTTGLAEELRATLTDTTDDLPW